MTKTIALILVVAAVLAFCTGFANVPSEPPKPIHTAKQIALHEAAETLRAAGFTDDDDCIKALQAQWWEEQEKLDILAKVIQNEAPPEWCQWEHSVAVGVVVLNRVRSEYFPNTVKEVVAAPGQYLKSYTYGFDNIPRIAYEAAKAALDGGHEVPSNAFWQDVHPQGVYTWKIFVTDTGSYYSETYICCGIPGVKG